MKFYRGSARAARDYVEAERGRADDYYLTEGAGFAERYSATADGQVRAMPQMDGDAYEAWVSGIDPETGELRGRVRNDEHALRFAEVVVNGPKSWSIAAELHPDIAAAYEAAQDRAATEIVRWMARNATTRVGPRGAQVATPVERLEAVSVRHYTSRAGDPHRHLHLQINARVEAAGKWRGIDSVAVRDSIGAVQGIGHATVMADPAFRQTLAAHGFTLDPETGEVRQLAGYAEAFSKRAEQISSQVAGYEAEWREAHPDAEPGPAVRRTWDARAWAEHRPDKAHLEAADVAHDRWLEELDALGYRPPERPVPIVATPVGQVDRDAAAAEVLARLTATRSAWNQHDVRGEAELLLARAGVITEVEVRRELAEDITARATATSVPFPFVTPDTPAHIRGWTSAEAIAVEQDLAGRLAVRGAEPGRDAAADQVDRAAAAAGVHLDPSQAEAAAALAGDHALVLVTGAAGAGKTTTLATTRAALAHDGSPGGHQMLVVTPTLKAARGARAETGAHTGSAAWLAVQHGWRWADDTGAWTRLAPGDVDPKTGTTYRGPSAEAQLRPGDLLVVDEAGMLDQDTARALLTVVDEQHARLALVGDPHQLTAIGRGGVLDLAGRWADRAVTLDVIHRFVHTVEVEPGVLASVEDTDYAALSLRMRQGATGIDADPAAVFDDLASRGQVHVHTSGEELRQHVAAQAAAEHRAGRPAAVSVATNEAAHQLNAAIRDQLVAGGAVDDGQSGGHVASTGTGQRIGAGDLVATRSNDRDADVANRDTWIVTAVHPDGTLTVAGTAGTAAAGGGQRALSAGYVNRHVELAYATTIHGVQGETATTGHLVLDEHTSASAAYVGMTRGRTANTVHLVSDAAADPLAAARQQWIDAAGRGRADLGVEAARAAAERAAAGYAAPAEPAVPDPERVVQVLDALHAAWTAQDLAEAQLKRLEPRLASAQADHAREQGVERTLGPLREARTSSHTAAAQAKQAAAEAREQLDTRTDEVRRSLRSDWNGDLAAAGADARTVQAGTGHFGRGRAGVNAARQRLDMWAEQWRPVLDQLPARLADPAALAAGWHAERVHFALEERTRQLVTDQLPDQVELVRAAEAADQTATQADTAYFTAEIAADERTLILRSARGHRGLAKELPRLTEQTTQARERLATAGQRIEQLTADPAITSQPDPESLLAAARTRWVGEQLKAELAAQQRAQQRAAAEPARLTDPTRHYGPTGPSYGRDPGRGGPSFGR
ncbi:MAG TPA: MobF family relaxase [Dermatophilaceae bacterium]|nr:MobF family relaxase [Dermatophilaceae bacterium]